MRIIGMRVGSVVVLLAACSAIAGCASIPTSGAVQAGEGEVVFDEDLFPISPQIPEDDPLRLVEGFVTASTAGVTDDFSNIRGYLVGSAASEWDPLAKVTIYGTGDFTSVWDEEASTVTYSLPLAATVSADGQMTEYEAGTRATVIFEVYNVSSGRWRISSLDDGILISEAGLALVFRPVILTFGSRDGQVAVSDLRWFPRRNIATHATLALINGPSHWLKDAVQTGLAPTAKLVVDAVPVEGGQADVALSTGSVGSATESTLALEQIQRTLLALPDVAGVNVTVGGLTMGMDPGGTLSDPPVPSSKAAVIIDGRLGVWDGEQILVPDGAGRLPGDSHDVAFAYDEEKVAVVVGEGTLATASIPGNLVPAGEAKPAVRNVTLSTVLKGDRLTAPSFDREGWLWTAEAEGEGLLHAIGPKGERVDLSIPGAEGRDIGGIAVSHDGVRVAILSREGGLWRLGVLALVRAQDGTPSFAGAILDIGAEMGSSEEVVWVDDRVIAVLGAAEQGGTGTVRLVTIGGRTEAIASPTNAVGLAARNGVGSITAITRDGSLYLRVNTVWSPVVTGSSVTGFAFSG